MGATFQALAMYCINPVIKNNGFWHLNMKYACKPYGFWKDVECWARFSFHGVVDVETMLLQRIWFNSHIKIRDRPFRYDTMRLKGVYKIFDIIDFQTGYFYYFYTYENITKIFKNRRKISGLFFTERSYSD